MDSLLEQLISRGDRVEINSGRLKIYPYSGNDVPDAWFKANSAELVRSILEATGKDGYLYEDFSTGLYSRYSGVTLNFQDILLREFRYAIYNVGLKYSRGRKKGQALPKNQFHPSRKGKFLKFWYRTGLDLPQGRRSRIAEHMGWLKGIVYNARMTEKVDRLDKDSIAPLSVSFDDICFALRWNPNTEQFSDTVRTVCGQATDEKPPKCSDKKLLQDSVITESQADFSAGQLNADIRLQDNKVIRDKDKGLDSSTQMWLQALGGE